MGTLMTVLFMSFLLVRFNCSDKVFCRGCFFVFFFNPISYWFLSTVCKLEKSGNDAVRQQHTFDQKHYLLNIKVVIIKTQSLLTPNSRLTWARKRNRINSAYCSTVGSENQWIQANSYNKAWWWWATPAAALTAVMPLTSTLLKLHESLCNLHHACRSWSTYWDPIE